MGWSDGWWEGMRGEGIFAQILVNGNSFPCPCKITHLNHEAWRKWIQPSATMQSVIKSLHNRGDGVRGEGILAPDIIWCQLFLPQRISHLNHKTRSIVLPNHTWAYYQDRLGNEPGNTKHTSMHKLKVELTSLSMAFSIPYHISGLFKICIAYLVHFNFA